MISSRFNTLNCLPRVVSLFRVDDTAVVNADFSIPQILLTPRTTTCSGFGQLTLLLTMSGLAVVLTLSKLLVAW